MKKHLFLIPLLAIIFLLHSCNTSKGLSYGYLGKPEYQLDTIGINISITSVMRKYQNHIFFLSKIVLVNNTKEAVYYVPCNTKIHSPLMRGERPNVSYFKESDFPNYPEPNDSLHCNKKPTLLPIYPKDQTIFSYDMFKKVTQKYKWKYFLKILVNEELTISKQILIKQSGDTIFLPEIKFKPLIDNY